MSLVDYDYDIGEEHEILSTAQVNKSDGETKEVSKKLSGNSSPLSLNSTGGINERNIGDEEEGSEDVNVDSKLRSYESDDANDTSVDVRKRQQISNSIITPSSDAEFSPVILEQIKRLRKLQKNGTTVNANIAQWLEFKNPYLLDKIMQLFDIYAYCSNYPTDIFDPSAVPLAENTHEHTSKQQSGGQTKSKAADSSAPKLKRNARYASKWDNQNTAASTSSKDIFVNTTVEEAVAEAVKSAQSRLAAATVKSQVQ